MDLRQWLDGTEDRAKADAARAAHTKLVYLEQIAQGKRRPSPVLCYRLLRAIPELTLRELRPDLADLCDLVNGAHAGRKGR